MAEAAHQIAPASRRPFRWIPSILLLLLAVPSLSSSQEPTFDDLPVWISTVNRTLSVALGDVDMDGDLDLVRGNRSEEAQLHLNSGGLFATSPSWKGPPEATESIALGDVDGDGDLDLVRGNSNEGTTLYLNSGGTFSGSPSWIGPVESTTDVALGDVDGDGDLDLVRGNVSEATTLYLNTGGSFAPLPAWSGPVERTSSVALGDIDGDGRLDLVRGNADQEATLYLNVGGAFDSSPAWTGPSEGTADVALGDLDGDGDLDLVRGNAFDVTDGVYSILWFETTVYRNTGGTFGQEPVWRGSPERTLSVELGDVDGDGDLDLIRGNFDGPTLHLNGGGSFSLLPDWIGIRETSNQSVVLGDVDGDDDLDLIHGNDGRASSLYLNLGGHLAPAPAWVGPEESTTSVTLGDVDGDGDLDLIQGSDRDPSSLVRNDSGVFHVAWLNQEESTQSVALADVDLDGDPDLLLGNFNQGSSLYRNSGGFFQFDQAPAWSGPVEPTRSLAVADIDGDGDIDLVRGNSGAGATLTLNQGRRLFGDIVWTGPSDVGTASVAAGDVDGDGRPDLVGEGALFLNRNGTLRDVPDWVESVTGISSVALGDVDGDGDLDLARGGLSSGAQLSLFAEGVFDGDPIWMGERENTYAIALDDMDGDGDLDLVTGNFGSATLYPNEGGALALAPTWRGPFESTRSLALGDVDGDGDVDLVRGNDAEPSTLYLNKSPWLVPSPEAQPSGLLPNNAAHLRWVRADTAGTNRYRISFECFDVESDPLWIVGEYQHKGSPVWHPMDSESSASRYGPFATSPDGVSNHLIWVVTRLPIDPRNVVIRLRAVSQPHRAGSIQFIPSYVRDVGRIVPERPVVFVPESVVFTTLTVGDSATVTVRIANHGNQDLVVNRLETSDPDLIATATLPAVVPPETDVAIDVVLAPRRFFSSPGPLLIESNDPMTPVVEIPVTTDIRALSVESRLLTSGSHVPLGEATTIVVTPGAGVRVERGFVYYRPREAGPAFPDSVPLLLNRDSGFFLGVIPGRGVTEFGFDYYIRVENSGIFSTDPPGAPEAVFFQEVESPSAVRAGALPDAAGGYPVGSPTRVFVDLPIGSRFEEGRLFYRAGGKTDYDSLDLALTELTPGFPTPAAVIPAGDVGPRGLEFWVRVKTSTRILTDPGENPAARPRALRTTVPSLEEPQTHAGGRYRMISVPLTLNLPITSSLDALLSDQVEFGPYDPLRWRSFRYLPSAGRYAELTEPQPSGDSHPEPGRGFWIINRADSRIDTAPIAGLSTPTDGPFRLRLEPGWNQIGNPFDFPVEWDDVTPEEGPGPVLEPPVGWDELKQEYREEAGVLAPFEGYWIRNPTAEAMYLLVPPVEAAQVTSGQRNARSSRQEIDPRPDEESEGWHVDLSAVSASARDSRNVFGTHVSASPGFDAYDRSDPPPMPGAALSIYFLPGADEGPNHPLTIDIRPPVPESGSPAERGRRWVFDLARSWSLGSGSHAATPVQVEIEFKGLSSVPPDLELRLVDREVKQVIDLRLVSKYTFVAGDRGYLSDESDARFEILAGTASFISAVEGGLADHPKRTRILAGFPNPIRTATAIRFETAVAGLVQLSVFDVAGRRIRSLVDGPLESGLHELIWNGDDEGGRSVPSGIYFLRLVGPDARDSRKLMKMP